MLLFYLALIMLNALPIFTYTAGIRKELIQESSQKVSADYCARQGTSLWDFSDITERAEALEYLNDLEDGQSAWIEGRAIFSPFLNWIGCFKNDSSLRQYEFNTFQVEKKNILYVCQHKCRYYLRGYIGVTIQNCFCFPWLLDRLNRVSFSNCSMRCSNFSFESCGGHNALSLYQRDMSHFSNRPRASAGQCMYMYMYAPTSVLLVSEPRSISCLSPLSPPHHAIVHYICVQKTGHNCSKFGDNFGESCIFINASTSWFDAIEECQSRGGNLLFDDSSTILNDVRSVLQNCKNCSYFWLGVYRTFLPTYKTDGLQDTNACLSVRKVGESFYIVTDNCFARKTFRCKPILSENSDISLANNHIMPTDSTHSMKLSVVSLSITPTNATQSVNQRVESRNIILTNSNRSVNLSTENDETISKISPAFQVGLVTVLLINGIVILLVSVFCFKHRIKRRKHRQVTGDNNRAAHASGDLRHQHACSNVTQESHDHEYASIFELHDELSLTNERPFPELDSAHSYEEFMAPNDRCSYTDLEATDSCQRVDEQQEQLDDTTQ